MVTRGCQQEVLGRAHRLVGLLVIVLLMLAVRPAPVDAHATLLGSTPTNGEELVSSPAEIILEFSEPVGAVEGGTVLHGSVIDSIVLSPIAQGSSVTVPLAQPLDDGAYILQWRMISADSHPISGTVSFTVGDADPDSVGSVTSEIPGWVEWSRTIAVALKYVGLLGACGVLLVGVCLIRADFEPTTRVASLFAVTGLIGIVAELPFAVMMQRGEVISSASVMWAAIRGLDSGTRIAALTGVVSVGLVLLGGKRFRGWKVPLLLMTIALLSLVLSGHTRSQRPIWLMMIADTTHVITAAVWLGGIVLMTLGLRGRWRGEGFASADLQFRAVSRFSVLAGWTAAGVMLSGVAMALVILDSFTALFDTEYGITLLIKIGLVLMVLLMATANRFWLIPRREHDADGSMSWLRRVVTVELVVLVAIAAITGSLVHRDPNVQADTAEIEQQSVLVYEGESALDAEHTVRLRVTSNSRNEVTIVATIIDENRDIILPDANLQLTWFLPERNLGPLSQELFLDTATGAFIGTYSLPAAGDWELGLQIRIDRFTDSRTTIDVVIP